ncbi:hypothetical protein DTW90_37215 [Neorhizobium sp. P12A]|uniref:hypothetical protein n=1 Tax=Neorhizobium sp. P12A TaxID=2268027 RepID=UPI0011EC3582|nr:hypothetical protein [Neorhizobium sp. P12A]KAA0681163.1 hypothetical protein DTW90_37215 [Neorhizobium sp. P12A]
MNFLRVIALALILLTLLGAALVRIHIDPVLGYWAIGIRFVVFAAISAVIAKIVPGKATVAIVASILLAGGAVGLREVFMGSQVAGVNLIAAVTGSVWGAAMAHGVRKNFL